jgi:hypothetical protein
VQIRIRPAGQQPWVVLELKVEVGADLPPVTNDG